MSESNIPYMHEITLLDYFANGYMQGVMASDDNIPDYDFVAVGAYKMAKAMLKERDRIRGEK